jgi:hypothetical protein
MKLLKKFPDSHLYEYAGQEFFDRPYFLDVNPYAFLVIIDYMKTGELFVPRNVNSDLVKSLLREFNIPFSCFLETENEAILPQQIPHTLAKRIEPPNAFLSRQTTPTDYSAPVNSYALPQCMNDPPAYENTPSHLHWSGEKATPSWLQQVQSETRSDSSSQIGDIRYTHRLDNQEKIMYKKLEPLVFQFILPLISNHVGSGHSRLRIYICPPEVRKEKIANDTQEEDVGYPKEYFASRPENGCPDLLFLTQPKVVDLVKKTIGFATGIKNMYANVKNVTTRSETPFGLIESKSFDLLVLSFEIPPNCAF